jgi:hypothetical protein
MPRSWTNWSDMLGGGHVEVSPQLRQRLDQLQAESAEGLVALEALATDDRQWLIALTVEQAHSRPGCVNVSPTPVDDTPTTRVDPHPEHRRGGGTAR